MWLSFVRDSPGKTQIHCLAHSVSLFSFYRFIFDLDLYFYDYSDLDKITHRVFFDVEIENGEGGRVVLGLFGDGKGSNQNSSRGSIEMSIVSSHHLYRFVFTFEFHNTSP